MSNMSDELFYFTTYVLAIFGVGPEGLHAQSGGRHLDGFHFTMRV